MPDLFAGVRKTFTGLTDKFLGLDITGNTLFDVTGSFFTEHQRDYTNVRLERYKTNWSFYKGEQFKRMTSEGKRKLVINLCRPIVNKSVDWLFGHGFKFMTPPGNERLIPMLDLVWNMNGRNLMMWEHGQTGSVSGDAFLYISIEDRDPLTGKALPLDDQRIVISNLNPSYVHPIYDTADPREMLACLIQYPVTLNYDPLNTNRGNHRSVGLYTVMIDRKEIREYWNRSEITEMRRANFLGRVPVVHTRNIPIATSFFGQSDLDDIVDLNANLCEVGNEIDEIIKYHSSPTTLIFGAHAKNLEKGANKVWSGLPKDARVENLALISDLRAANDYFSTLKLAIHELSNTPESSLGKIQEVSNTSAAAMEVMYMPLIEKTKRKYLTYGASIIQANEIILQIMDQRFGVDIEGMCQDKESVYMTTVDFNSPLPTDKKLQVDMLVAKVDKGLESKAGALRELGEKDPQRKMLEIIADKRETLAEEVERAVASGGTKPLNLAVYSLGSFAINLPSLQSAFTAQDKALDELLTEGKQQLMDDISNAAPPAPPAGPPKK